MSDKINTNLDTNELPQNTYKAKDREAASLANWIRQKTYGRHVRESIARFVELTSDKLFDTVQMTSETVRVANETQERLNQQIGALTEDAEVIDARGGNSLLGERLDDIDNSIKMISAFKNVLNFGVKNDGSDTEAELNDLPAGGTYYFPAGIYSVRGFSETEKEVGFRIKNNTTYVFDNNAVLKVIPNGSQQYCAVGITNARNFVIDNVTILGDKTDHDFSEVGTHERGAGIMIRGNSKGVIKYPKITNMTGDGIDIICSTGSDLIIDNPIISDVRRNGISCESVDRLVIINPTISNVKGTLPEAGIDFEPFDTSHIFNDVRVINGKITNSNAMGILVANLPEDAQLTLDSVESDGVRFVGFFLKQTTRKVKMITPKIIKRGLIVSDAGVYADIISPYIEFHGTGTQRNTPIYIEKTKYTQLPCGFINISNAVLKNPNGLSDVSPITFDITKVDSNITNYNLIRNVNISIAHNEFKSKAVDTKGVLEISMPESVVDLVPNAEVSLDRHMIANTDFFYGSTVNNTGASYKVNHNIGNTTAGRMVGQKIKFEVTNPNGIVVSATSGILPSGKSSLTSTEVGSSITIQIKNVGGSRRFVVVEQIGTWT